jgi:hypothetical protein
MGAMKKGNDVCGRGLVLTVMAVLLIPAAAVAADNPTVRVTQPGVGRVVLDVSDDAVAVRKEITADRSVVTLTTAKEQLTISTRRGVLTLTGPRETVSVVGGSGADGGRFIAVLQQSDAASKALRLLERVSEGPVTFASQSLLLTRAVLEVGKGSHAALDKHQQWVAAQAPAMLARPRPVVERPMVIRAAWGDSEQKTPGDCWDIYSLEAFRIYNDLVACKDQLSWYEVIDLAGCMLIYVIRAEAAVAWYIACNGGLPFSG